MTGANNAKTCATCEHARPVPLAPTALQCFGAPPSVVAMMKDIPGIGQQISMVSFFPAVEPQESCGQWQEKTKPDAGDNAGANVALPQAKGGAHGEA